MKLTNLLCMTLMALMLWLSGCSKTDDSADLLKSVPAGSGVVALIHLDRIVEDACGKVDNGKITDAGVFEKLLSRKFDSEREAGFLNFLRVENGVRMTSMVIFEYKGTPVASFMLNDEKKFVEAIRNSKSNITIREENGATLIDGDILVLEKQVWMMDGVTRAKVDVLRHLTDKESFAGVAYAENLESDDNVIDYIVDINMAPDLLPYGTVNAQTTMAISFLYDDAKYLAGSVKFETGKAEIEISVLTSKFVPAKSALALADVNMQELKSFPGKGELFFVLNPEQSMISSMLGKFGALAVIPDEMENLLKSLEGQIMVSMGAFDSLGGTVPAVISIGFNSEASATAATEYLAAEQIFGPVVRTEGKRVLISPFEDRVITGIPVSEIADNFEGSAGGFYVNSDFNSGILPENIGKNFKGVGLFFENEGGTLILKAVVKTNPDSNALVSFIEAFLN